MINAVIFDMDGLLIDSEPFWQESEILCFGRAGLELTQEMCVRTMGMRIDEVVEYWHRQHPWERLTKKQVEEGIIDGVIELIAARGEPLAGVREALGFVKEKGARTALASSSAYRIIQAVLGKFELTASFDLVYSAEDEEYGKPHPGVYLTTARRLGVRPEECLAIEDSVNGVVAAKAAKMRCLAVPEPAARADRRYGIADLVLPSLAEFDDRAWDALTAR